MFNETVPVTLAYKSHILTDLCGDKNWRVMTIQVPETGLRSPLPKEAVCETHLRQVVLRGGEMISSQEAF